MIKELLTLLACPYRMVRPSYKSDDPIWERVEAVVSVVFQLAVVAFLYVLFTK